jgi:hypothetical protein
MIGQGPRRGGMTANNAARTVSQIRSDVVLDWVLTTCGDKPEMSFDGDETLSGALSRCRGFRLSIDISGVGGSATVGGESWDDLVKHYCG